MKNSKSEIQKFDFRNLDDQAKFSLADWLTDGSDLVVVNLEMFGFVTFIISLSHLSDRLVLWINDFPVKDPNRSSSRP